MRLQGASPRPWRCIAWLLLLLASVAPGASTRAARRSLDEVLEGQLAARAPDTGPSCDLCAQNWLFVLGAGGRTGSTTALGMFADVPGFDLQGEHEGMLNSMAQAIANGYRSSKYPKSASWKHRTVDGHGTKCLVQEFLRRMLLGADFAALTGAFPVLGFKEIRYIKPDSLAFLGAVFPCARYVLTYRENPDAPVRNPDFNAAHTHQEWSAAAELAERFHERFPNTSALLPVEHMEVGRYNAALHGLLGVQGCSFSAVIHDNAAGGYSQHTAPPASAGHLTGDCDLSGLDFRLSPEQQAAHAGTLGELWSQQTPNRKDVMGIPLSFFGQDFARSVIAQRGTALPKGGGRWKQWQARTGEGMRGDKLNQAAALVGRQQGSLGKRPNGEQHGTNARVQGLAQRQQEMLRKRFHREQLRTGEALDGRAGRGGGAEPPPPPTPPPARNVH